ncbi:MAG: hypothetical protein U0587_12795 [Candidatus Binatia bacterium]
MELFVTVLGASHYTYAEVTPTPQIDCGSQTRAGILRGGDRTGHSDHLKSAVSQLHHIRARDPTYLPEEEHYVRGGAVRRERRGKMCRAEAGAGRAALILPMRHQTFFSFEELSACVRSCSRSSTPA